MQKAFSRHWYLRANLSAFLRTRTLGRTAPKNTDNLWLRQLLFVLKSFINSLLYVKSNECRSALRKLQHSNPCNSTGKHLDLTSSRITTSEARFSSLPNTSLIARKNDRFEWLKERALTTKIPRYLISETHGKYRPSLVCRLAQLALQRGLLLPAYLRRVCHQDYAKTTQSIFTKVGGTVAPHHSADGKKRLDFGDNPDRST